MLFSQYFKKWVSLYYKNARIGKNGDFYTAVSVSRFFGGAIARYILKRLESGQIKLPLNIVDVGGNSHILLNDIYDFLNALSVNVLPYCEFILLESNHLVESSPKIKVVQSLDSISHKITTLFVANEFFDALPCELLLEDKLAFIYNHNIIFKTADFFTNNQKEILTLAKRFGIHKGEIPLSYFDFCRLLKPFCRYMFLVFDYGKMAINDDFSLRIFHKHRIFEPFSCELKHFFGVSDITYNVPFLLLNQAFSDIGAQNILFKRQDLTLIEDFGVLDLLQDFYESNQQNSIYMREANKIKTLLNELSKNFQVAIYSNF